MPLLRWSQLPVGQRSQQAYRAAIGAYVAGALTSSNLGWTAEAGEIEMSVNTYLDRILARAQARDRIRSAQSVRLRRHVKRHWSDWRFSKAGCAIDHKSVEIAARWSRWLGLASFTYHAPGPYALRYWSAARINLHGNTAAVERRAGGQFRDRALDALHEYCQQAAPPGTTYVPVWEVRAAVCWKLRIVDDEFDRAITDMIAGRRGEHSAGACTWISSPSDPCRPLPRHSCSPPLSQGLALTTS